MHRIALHVTGLLLVACAQATVDPTLAEQGGVFGRGGPSDTPEEDGGLPAPTDPFFVRPDGAIPDRPTVVSSSGTPQVLGGDAGTGSSMGAPSVMVVCRVGGPSSAAQGELIDDLEDGNTRVLPNGGRSGSWSGPHDDTAGGVQAPDPFVVTEIAGCANARYAHVRGRGFQDWGSHMTFNFMSGKAPYDMSRYGAVSFWARSQRSTKVRVNFPNKDSDKAGGLCEATPATGTTVGCHNHFGVELSLGTAWTKHTVLFKDIKQEPFWGRQPATFDAAVVYSMTFAIPKNVTYDVWLDDLAFLPK